MAKRRWLPDNVSSYRDRHGKKRYRFRKKGLPTYPFKNEPGTEEFREEYQLAQQGIRPTDRHAAFTYDALIASFYRTTRWVDMADSSKRTYGNIIERFRAKNGDKDVRRITAAAIDNKLIAMHSTPSAANNLRKILARLHRHAMKMGWRTDNPVSATDGFKVNNEGYHCWTELEIAQYEAKWPLGTRERLAMALLLHTALRRSDMVTIGRQHLRDGELHLHHTKNKSDTTIPVTPELAKVLGSMSAEHLTYLVTANGKPFTSNGFGNWFRKRCDQAGLKNCSAHGLRKAMSRRLAESGATTLEGRAITGHKTDKEFAHYSESANRRTLASAGMSKVVANRFGEPAPKGKKND